ncbi:MAG: hypothetical protein ACE5EA_07635 [Nitrospirota bacterium]
MKNIIIIIIIFFLTSFFLPHTLEAIEKLDGDTDICADPCQTKNRFTANILFEKAQRKVVEEDRPGERLQADTDSTRVLSQIGMRITDYFVVYGKIGTANLDIISFHGYDAGFDILYGGGISIKLFDSHKKQPLRILLSGDSVKFRTDSTVKTEVGVESEEIDWIEYTLRLGLSKEYRYLQPYIGVIASEIKGSDLLSISGDLDFSSEDNLGLFFGSNIFIDTSKSISLNIESYLLDEGSFSLMTGLNLHLF